MKYAQTVPIVLELLAQRGPMTTAELDAALAPRRVYTITLARMVENLLLTADISPEGPELDLWTATPAALRFRREPWIAGTDPWIAQYLRSVKA